MKFRKHFPSTNEFQYVLVFRNNPAMTVQSGPFFWKNVNQEKSAKDNTDFHVIQFIYWLR